MLTEKDVAIVSAQTQRDAETAMKEVCGELEDSFLPTSPDGSRVAITEKLERFYDQEEAMMAIAQSEEGLAGTLNDNPECIPETGSSGILVCGNAQRALGFIAALRRVEGLRGT